MQIINETIESQLSHFKVGDYLMDRRSSRDGPFCFKILNKNLGKLDQSLGDETCVE